MYLIIRRIPPDMTFGISTRPSTPVFDLLEHKFQDRWLSNRRKVELDKRERTVQQVCMFTLTLILAIKYIINIYLKVFCLFQQKLDGRIYETRASLLRKYQPRVESAPLWQMPKYNKVKNAFKVKFDKLIDEKV